MTRPIRERFIRQGPRSLSEKRHFRGMSDPCDPDHMSLEYLVIDADDRLFNLILYSKYNVMFYTVYFLIVQILTIILDQGVIILC